MLAEYLPIVLLLGLSTAFAVLSILAARMVGPQRPNPTKLAAYECGNEPLAVVSGARFPVKFYLVAMMFLIFDVETVFLFPWALAFRQLGWFGLAEMAVFVALLFIAYAYVIRRGGLEWE